jgi:DNA processing protein
MPPLPQHFPARNRIISGLSLGLVVVEAARNSGALITANFAAEQGRDVFAIPGRISSTTSAGTNDLIKDGARLVQSVDDIMEELKLCELKPLAGQPQEKIEGKIAKMTKAYVYNSLTDDERQVYAMVSDEPTYIDDIAGKSGMGLSRSSKALLSLQLKQLIREIPGKQYVRKGE